jgi:hypothetical protein
MTEKIDKIDKIVSGTGDDGQKFTRVTSLASFALWLAVAKQKRLKANRRSGRLSLSWTISLTLTNHQGMTEDSHQGKTSARSYQTNASDSSTSDAMQSASKSGNSQSILPSVSFKLFCPLLNSSVFHFVSCIFPRLNALFLPKLSRFWHKPRQNRQARRISLVWYAFIRPSPYIFEFCTAL